jgi:hypothetical protein
VATLRRASRYEMTGEAELPSTKLGLEVDQHRALERPARTNGFVKGGRDRETEAAWLGESTGAWLGAA